jgi:hypothetical protein
VSLLGSRPERPGNELPRIRRGGPLVVTVFAVLLTVTAAAQSVLRLLGKDVQPLSDPGPGLALALGTVALLPVALAGTAGWVVARTTVPDLRTGPWWLGGLLLAVVAASVGIGFALELLADTVGDVAVFDALTLGYHYGRQPVGMLVGWAAWLMAFTAMARLALAAAPRVPEALRGVLGVLAAATATWVAVTAGTWAQFAGSSAPRDEAGHWFSQWLIPTGPSAPEAAPPGAPGQIVESRSPVGSTGSRPPETHSDSSRPGRTCCSRVPRSGWRTC